MQKVFFFDGSVSKNEVIELNKPDSNSEILGIIVGDNSDTFDLQLQTLHLAPRTTARTDIRVVLKDQAVCNLKGLIKIVPEAHQTDAFLTIKGLLLSDEAKLETIPSLEIEANDVKASHSASSGPPDPEQVFYLTSRGLSQNQAVQLLVEGFLGEVVERVKDDKMRRKIERSIKYFESSIHP